MTFLLDRIICGDSSEELPALREGSVDAIVTDPPYFLLNEAGKGFMGKEWESLNRKKSIDILCRSKEFAHFVERIFTLLKVESNLEEASSVQGNANTKDNSSLTSSSVNAPCVEKKSNGTPPNSKANINSVQGIVLTKGALLDLLKGLSLNHITVIESHRENALFAVPILFIENLLKKHAPRSVNISMPKRADGSEARAILLTSMEDQRIKEVIEAMTGKTSENLSMPETITDAKSAINTAEGMKYRLITSEDIKNPLITQWLIWLLYVIDATSRSSTTGKTLTDFLNSDLIYQFHKQWAEAAFRVLKPGAHLLAFGGTRTYHTMARAIEDAGFECRDMINWVTGSGFPKSLDISKALDKMAGAEREVIGINPNAIGRTKNKTGGNYGNDHESDRSLVDVLTAPSTDAAKQWAGFGSALKPAHEPICLVRKPLDGCTIAENVIRWGVGGLNIDRCRIPGASGDGHWAGAPKVSKNGIYGSDLREKPDFGNVNPNSAGRFPANLILSFDEGTPGCPNPGKEAVMRLFPETCKHADKRQFKVQRSARNDGTGAIYGKDTNLDPQPCYSDIGSAARFFQQCSITEDDLNYDALIYCSKASRSEREKGLDGMQEVSKKDRMGGSAGHGNHNPVCQTCKRSKFDRGNGICDCVNPDWKVLNQQNKNNHPTVKPLALMRYLCRLITPPNGLILDPFAGSGTTCLAAKQEGFHFLGIEKEPEYVEIANRRLASIPISLKQFS